VPLLWVYVLRAAFDTTLALFYMVQLKFDHVHAIMCAYDAFFAHYRAAYSQRTYLRNPLKRFSVLLGF
jgi:hypothetical protein